MDLDRVKHRLQDGEVSPDLAVSYLGDSSSLLNQVESFLAGFLMGPDELPGFSRTGDIYTDGHPQLEFTWTEFPVMGPERKDLLVLNNTEIIEGHLGETGRYVAGEGDLPEWEQIRTLRQSYLRQLKAAAWDNLGSYAMARGLIEQALSGYRRAIEFQPGFAQAHNNLGSLLLRMGSIPEAISAYREAIRIDPDYAEAHFNLGIAYNRQGRAPDAVYAYQQAIRARPDFVLAYLNLARTYQQRGAPEEAKTAYQKAMEMDPTRSEAYLGLAVVLAQSGEVEQAIQITGELLERDGDDPRARELDRQLRQMRTESNGGRP